MTFLSFPNVFSGSLFLAFVVGILAISAVQGQSKSAEYQHAIGSGQPNLYEVGQLSTNNEEKENEDAIVPPAPENVNIMPASLSVASKCVPTGQTCSVGQQCCSREMCPHPPFKMICSEKAFTPVNKF